MYKMSRVESFRLKGNIRIPSVYKNLKNSKKSWKNGKAEKQRTFRKVVYKYKDTLNTPGSKIWFYFFFIFPYKVGNIFEPLFYFCIYPNIRSKVHSIHYCCDSEINGPAAYTISHVRAKGELQERP